MSSEHRIPTPREDLYWNREALLAEEKRVFQICNGCRLCWNLCPSFPALFNAVDALDVDEEPATSPSRPEAGTSHAAEARSDVMGQQQALERIPWSVHQEVVDLCYQCKLCDPICPYQPPHEFAVDFPRLMLRHKAIDAKERGVKLQDRVLGDPDLIGRLGTILPALANWGTELRANRVMMEMTVGIHRDRRLPRFAGETFRHWFERTHPNPPDPTAVEGRKVVLFYTCSVQWNEPQVGRAAVEVLEHNGVTVFAPEFRCCGMPALDGGDVPRATAWAKRNVEVLTPYVQAGCDIVSPGPTCSYMMRREWSDYLGSAEARAIAEHTFDLMEYLYTLRKAGELDRDFPHEVGRIHYHLPCHLKVQRIGFRSRELLKKLPGAQVKLVDRCSCMDGTWGMKKEYYDLSKAGAKKLLEELSPAHSQARPDAEEPPPTLSSDCLIAKLQIEEGTRQPVLHPIEILWKAYGLDRAGGADKESQ